MVESRPTLDTVAHEAGVSRMTVSNAYNRPDQLSEATRARVLEAAARLGYPGPDPVGRSLRRRRVDTIGVLITESLPYAFTDPGMVSLLRGMATGLCEAGQAMLLVPAEADYEGSMVRQALVDGFIICSMDEGDPAVRAVRDRRLPLVTVSHPRLRGVPNVGIDNRTAGMLAARHLLDLGHRRAGVVGLPTREPGDPAGVTQPLRLGLMRRVEGFRSAWAEAGLAPDMVSVVMASANTAACGAEAAGSLLGGAARRRPTAVFTVTDVLAFGVLDAAEGLGLPVPGSLSVVGFDDIDEAARRTPALTTVRQPLTEQGQTAARMVLDLVAGREVRAPRFPAELVVRGSTGPVGPRTD